jgi:hypothetical protein
MDLLLELDYLTVREFLTRSRPRLKNLLRTNNTYIPHSKSTIQTPLTLYLIISIPIPLSLPISLRLQLLPLLNHTLNHLIMPLPLLNHKHMSGPLSNNPHSRLQHLDQFPAMGDSDHIVFCPVQNHDSFSPNFVTNFFELCGTFVVPACGYGLKHEAFLLESERMVSRDGLEGGED